MQNFEKAYVIAVDAGTFDLIDKWVAEDRLPTFKALLQSGVSSVLNSTIPPITGPAWTTFQTGKNPGQHGIFDWLARNPEGYNLVPINSKSITHDSIWGIISSLGKKVGVINVPMTYPPPSVNGFLISGLPAPDSSDDFVYPKILREELKREVPDYAILPPLEYSKDTAKWLKGLIATLEARQKTTLHMMQHQDWDFFMTHFMETDIVQHYAWHLLKDGGGPIWEVYKVVDRMIGEIWERLDENTALFVISDHGAGPLYDYVYLNQWLLNEGFLHLKRDPFTYFKRLLYKLNLAPANIYRFLDKIGLIDRALKLGKGQRYSLLRRFFLSVDNIDWSRTTAYSYGNIGQIYLNRIGREPEGIVTDEQSSSILDELQSKLSNLKHPRTELPLFEQIFRGGEIYFGERVAEAPDLVLFPQNLEAMAVGVSEFVSNKVIEPSFSFTGGHRMEGILISAGRGFKQNQRVDQSDLSDMAPTILYSLGIPIPSDMDGRVLDKLFSQDFLDAVEKKETEKGPSSRDEDKNSSFSSEEEKEIMERLKDLGYIS